MFGSSYKVAKVWGIPIKVDISLIILLVVIAALGIQAKDSVTAILLALLFMVGFFISIALHELGHSFVAIRKGCRVREITLMFIGGAAQMEKIPRRPIDEFLMAIAGPAVSVAIGVLLWNLGGKLPMQSGPWPIPLIPGEVTCNAVQFLGMLNIWLALFNMIPAFPMDGGRLLRSMLTPRLGRLRATGIAARLGRFLALGFGIIGIFPPMNFIQVAIAFFIYVSAGNEYRYVQMEEERRQQFGDWPPFGQDPIEDVDDNEVIISPPPYEKGRGTRTEIHPERDRNPFRNIFGR